MVISHFCQSCCALERCRTFLKLSDFRRLRRVVLFLQCSSSRLSSVRVGVLSIVVSMDGGVALFHSSVCSVSFVYEVSNGWGDPREV